MRSRLGVVAGLLAIPVSLAGSQARAEDGASPVELTVLDRQTGQPVACRVHLSDAAGKPQRPPALPFWRDHFACPGTARLEVAPGDYTYEVERGPEYARAGGRFTARDKAPVKVQVELHRLADLAKEGWWSGELHVHRPVAEVPLLMQAEDLHVAPVITWWHNRKTTGTSGTARARAPSGSPPTPWSGSTATAITTSWPARTSAAAGPCSTSTSAGRSTCPARSSNTPRR